MGPDNKSELTPIWLVVTNSLTNSTIFQSESEDNSFVTIFDVFLPPVLIIVGTICNILVIKVMRSIYFRFVSTSFFIALTSGLDIFSLVILLTVHWLNVNFPTIIYRGEYSHIMCKIFNFLGWGTSDLGILLTTGMTTERALAILFPMKAPKLCTIKKAKTICAVIVFAITVKDFHFLISSDITPSSRRDLLCFVSPDSGFFKDFWSNIWPWLHNGFLCVSFVVIIVSNCIIIGYIRVADKVFNSKLSELNRKKTRNSTASIQRRAHTKRRQIAILLLVASFTIIACTLPFSVFVTLDSNMILLDSNANERSIKHMISSLSFYLLYVNRCGNFFLYCISGTRFRKSLKIIMCSCQNKEGAILSDNLDPVSKQYTSKKNSVIASVSLDIRYNQNIVSRNTDLITISTKF